MFSRAFLKDTAERALRTFAQAWLVVTASVQGGLVHVPWGASLSIAGLAALAAVLSALAYPAKTAPSPAPVEPRAPAPAVVP